jgi:hypothetical protein
VVEVTATRALQTFRSAIYSVTFAVCVGRDALPLSAIIRGRSGAFDN